MTRYTFRIFVANVCAKQRMIAWISYSYYL